MKQLALLAAIGLATSSLASSAQALDVVTRRSDKPVQGTITEITRDAITVKPGVSTPVTVPGNDIISVRWDAEPPDLNLGRGAESSGNLDRALEIYTKCLTESGSNDAIKTEVEFLIARAESAQGLDGNTAKLDDAAKKLEAFSKNRSGSFRFFESLHLLGQVHLAREDYAAAEQAFSRLTQAPWPDFKMAAQNATARLAMKKGDLTTALSSYEAVLGQNAGTPAEISRRNEALLGKASVQLEQNNAEAALTVVAEAILKSDPEDAAVQAEAFVLKGRCLESQGKIKEAILSYLHVPVLFSRQSVPLQEALYHLAVLWPKVDQQERGLAARQELEENYPESRWTKMLSQ